MTQVYQDTAANTGLEICQHQRTFGGNDRPGIDLNVDILSKRFSIKRDTVFSIGTEVGHNCITTPVRTHAHIILDVDAGCAR